MGFVTRFAPSPTGQLHLGHAYSALLAFDMAQKAGGRFLLRIEDTDTARCTPVFEAQVYDDLAWLGLSWETPVLRQSENTPAYEAALAQLAGMGLLYPCSCTRGDIRRAASAPQEGAPMHGPDGVIYPGTCRHRAWSERSETDAIRLHMGRAVDLMTTLPQYIETGVHPELRLTRAHLTDEIGDIVLARRDTKTAAYHLSVVVDDAAQDITHVIRGEDLAPATPIHVLLQALLGLPTPIYHHHRLIRDDLGKRLAKRDDARAIALYRAEGHTPQDIRNMVGL
ncbi:tRNA glutamyl-Q(34) synthetase GluQRS [Marivita sp. XM-24bin2]|jgi:glutamyl-Q tRNA(Asp) synthetase|uniref:tRNA glutamyl-Q(34) synthetase GluQRS n=1 Tax=unclassified Marivita TaxID=2632480 RepID=UPI000D7AA981|nr:tRNA glutamyl-Q(34) synthetase GluQRS [Marivita sp. XM-24bin2]MCR9108069.1 tRNA glutamyl-Q(34) synthetase GluQRS [Paracoccaceae bacterium]PWL36003.1 MAG: tRNA glutamyl-Q(34) synthetase GluQRS [Marivita sp. XM-24bin2]